MQPAFLSRATKSLTWRRSFSREARIQAFCALFSKKFCSYYKFKEYGLEICASFWQYIIIIQEQKINTIENHAEN